MNIKQQLANTPVCLLIIPSEKYNTAIVNIAKTLSAKNVCYVTLSKTYDSLKETFKKKGVNLKNIVFIDAISKTFKKSPEQTNQCYYVSSPGALTELAITIKKFLRHNFEYLIVDSITNLTTYQKQGTVTKFLSDIMNSIKTSKTKAVLYALDIKEQEALIKQIGSFADNTIKFS